LADFPEAQVHVSTLEKERALSPKTHMDRVRYLQKHFDHGPIWCPFTAMSGERWFGFDAVRALEDLTDDLLVLPLGGHSPGHVGVAVNSTEGWVLHAGDTYYQRHHLTRGMSFLDRAFRRMIDDDANAAEVNQRRIADLIDNHSEIRVFCSHDPKECTHHMLETSQELNQMVRRTIRQGDAG